MCLWVNSSETEKSLTRTSFACPTFEKVLMPAFLHNRDVTKGSLMPLPGQWQHPSPAVYPPPFLITFLPAKVQQSKEKTGFWLEAVNMGLITPFPTSGNRLKSICSVNSCSLYEHTYEYCCSLLYKGHSINSSCILKRTCAVCYSWWLQTCSDRCRVPGAWRTSVTSACCSTRPSRSLGSWAKWPRSAAATWSPACAAASVWWGRRRVTLLTRTQAARV